MRQLATIACAVCIMAARASAQETEEGDQLFVRLGPKAPYARVIVDGKADTCGRIGGEMSCNYAITGVLRTGRSVDLSFTDIDAKGLASSSAIFGAIDKTGMLQLVLEQNRAQGGKTYNLFVYKTVLRRYSFVKQVAGYAAGKRLL